MTTDNGFRITPRLILGLFVVATGVLFMLRELGIYHSEEINKYWPLILVAIGLTQLFNRGQGGACFGSRCGGRGAGGYVFPIALIGLGSWLMANNLGIFAVSPWDYFWPLLLILLGLSLVLGSRRSRRPGPKTDESAHVSAFCIFSGSDLKVNSPDFRGSNLTAIMGGCSLDLTQAGIAGDAAVVEVFALMGGIDIKVPRDWSVESRVMPLLGGVRDESEPTTARPGAPRLLIQGTAIMGSVEISN